MKEETNVIEVDVEVQKGTKEVESPVVMKWRYACPSCTNTAFLASNLMPFTKINCQSCGKELTECRLENYIPVQGVDYATS